MGKLSTLENTAMSREHLDFYCGNAESTSIGRSFTGQRFRSMCAKIISAVLTLQMLMCSFLGCCWHHTHCSDTACAPTTERHSCCHSDDEQAEDRSAENCPSEQSPAQLPCDEERCVFAKALPVDSLELLFRSMMTEGYFILTPTVETQRTALSFSQTTRFTSCCATSAERCAVLQVWLI